MQQANTTTPPYQNRGFNWNDFLSFKAMVTLRIIQILYVIVAIIITIGALVIMFKGDSGYRSAMPGGFFSGLVVLVFGNIIWRIWCELMIVIFRIHKSLNNIETGTTTR
jgi:hypothetical protein